MTWFGFGLDGGGGGGGGVVCRVLWSIAYYVAVEGHARTVGLLTAAHLEPN